MAARYMNGKLASLTTRFAIVRKTLSLNRIGAGIGLNANSSGEGSAYLKRYSRYSSLKAALLQRACQANFRAWFLAPIIRRLIVPTPLLNFSRALYQARCFRLCLMREAKCVGHPAFSRNDLAFLNPIEGFKEIDFALANRLTCCEELSAWAGPYLCSIGHARRIRENAFPVQSIYRFR
jgi:hypothetical protein